jgi:hypothetical protein
MKYSLILAAGLLLTACSQQTDPKKIEASSSDSLAAKASSSLQCEMTCPDCGHKKIELMPTDVCQLKYTCDSCKAELRPKDGDCCVFCSYGSHKCPSMQ